MSKKVLFVITSNGKLGNTGKPTGYWASEVSHPWKAIKDAGFEIDFVSPKGGKCPVEGEDLSDPIEKEFLADTQYQQKINASLSPDKVNPSDYCAIFFAGGHGVMWDFPDNTAIQKITSDIYEKGGIVGAVCHGPAGLVNVKLPSGKYLVDGKKINCFTDSEERAVKLQDVVPFLLESKLRERGAKFECSDNFQSHVVVNDRVITGQNPMSAYAVGLAIVTALQSLK